MSLHEAEEVPPYSPQQQRTSLMDMYHDTATNEEKRPLTQEETPTHMPTQMMVTPAVSLNSFFFFFYFILFFSIVFILKKKKKKLIFFVFYKI